MLFSQHRGVAHHRLLRVGESLSLKLDQRLRRQLYKKQQQISGFQGWDGFRGWFRGWFQGRGSPGRNFHPLGRSAAKTSVTISVGIRILSRKNLSALSECAEPSTEIRTLRRWAGEDDVVEVETVEALEPLRELTGVWVVGEFIWVKWKEAWLSLLGSMMTFQYLLTGLSSSFFFPGPSPRGAHAFKRYFMLYLCLMRSDFPARQDSCCCCAIITATLALLLLLLLLRGSSRRSYVVGMVIYYCNLLFLEVGTGGNVVFGGILTLPLLLFLFFFFFFLFERR